MSSERLGLVVRGTLLEAASRTVRSKSADSFVAYEARVLTERSVEIVGFFDAAEMGAALGEAKPGDAVELPVYPKLWNQTVFLRYRRGAQAVDVAAA